MLASLYDAAVEQVERLGQLETESTVGKALSPRKGLTPERGAAIVLWLGVVLVVLSIVGGLLTTFRSNSVISYFPPDADMSLLDRLQLFAQSSLTQVAWSAVVLGIGVGLHIWVRRPVAGTAVVAAPLPEIDESPVQLPPAGSGALSIAPLPPADDDFWRR